MRPIVALLTDFGTRDHYVGAVKGSILAACPDVQLVDLTHDVPTHDVAAGAFVLAAAYPAFPAGTVFVAVVDPGVGSDRRGLAVAAGGQVFVGPDNGIFGLVLEDHPGAEARVLANAALFRPEISLVFHGRDVFGPVAGHLAAGARVEDVGPRIADPVALPIPPVRRLSAHEWEASVQYIDRFGNLTTNLRSGALDEIAGSAGGDLGALVVSVGGAEARFVGTYSDVAAGSLCALVGSSRRLELAVNRDSAARALGATVGTPVRIASAPGGG